MTLTNQGGAGGNKPSALATPKRKRMCRMDERAIVPLDDLPDIATVEETARALRVSSTTVREAIKQGKLPSLVLGHHVIIPKLALMRVLESCGVPEITEGARGDEGDSSS